MTLQDNLFPDDLRSPKRKGLRLWRVEVLNWGTLGEDIVHGVDLHGGWLCITGRNGTGKSTLADAIVTAFPPANARIHYNAAGGAKNTKERTRLTYLRGYFGHEQDDTGKAQPSVLRNKPGSLTAILLQFHELSSKRWVTVLVLGTFTAQNEDEWLYGTLEEQADLSVVQGREDWDSRAKRLRRARWQLTGDPGVYRERLRSLLRIPSDKAITTFVRTVGLKDIGDVNAFIRGNMLDDISVHDRYVELTKHYQKQLEIDAEIETTRRMIEMLLPLGDLAPAYQQLGADLNRRDAVEAAIEWRIVAEKGEALQDLLRQATAKRGEADDLVNTAEAGAKRSEEWIGTLNASEPAKRIAALAVRRTELLERRHLVGARVDQLRAALHLIGGKVPADEASFKAMRDRLQGAVQDDEQSHEARGDALKEKKQQLEALEQKIAELRRHTAALRDVGSHLPLQDLQVRDEIARAVGLKPSELPYFGELVDVDPSQSVWRVALEKLLRTQARRILVSSDHFARVIAHVKATDFNTRVRLELVTTRTTRLSLTENDPRRAYGKLRIKPGAPFGDWLYNTLRTRFDHLCCSTLAEYERQQGTALDLDGLVKDRGDYHEKKDDIRIRGVRDHFLGWDNEDMIRSLRTEEAEVDRRRGGLAADVNEQRSANENARTRRDLAVELLKTLPSFELVDMGAVNRETASLERELQHLAKTDPEAAKVEKDLAQATEDLRKFRDSVREHTEKRGGFQREMEDLTGLLRDLDEAVTAEPENAAREAGAIFFKEPAPRVARLLEKWARDVRERGRKHFDAKLAERNAKAVTIQGVMTGYLTTFPLETKVLSASLDAIDAFLERLRYLEAEKLHELQERFRKYLEENLALHVSQVKSELESQASGFDRRIEEINKILALSPWEDSTVIRIQPRLNPQPEIQFFRDLLAKASAPLFAPTEDQRTSAFKAVKELIAYLATDNIRKLVLDSRNWRLFTVQVRNEGSDPTQPGGRPSYENTDGLSGGQKNKLSVTLLASALAFQYDIAGPRATPGTFRTVIIDEAFAKLDSENARYALDLFRRFDFQLVLVHPLDGTVRVAEDYVQGFLLATIRDNRHTSLTGIRIERFKELIAKAELEKRLGSAETTAIES